MATNFVAQNSDELACLAVIFMLAFENGWDDRKHLPTNDSAMPSTSRKNFLNSVQ